MGNERNRQFPCFPISQFPFVEGVCMKLKRCIFLLTALLACTAGRAADERHTIRPGEGIGVINLGMTVKEAHDAMSAWGTKPLLIGKSGGPGAWVDKQAGAAIEAYQTDSLGRDRWGNVMKIFYVKDTVVQIAVQSIAYATNKGATTRLSSSEFRAAHPSLHPVSARPSWGGRIRAYDSETMGLAVTYSVIQRDTEVRSAQEILVHKRGAKVILESPRHEGKLAPPALSAEKTASEESGN